MEVNSTNFVNDNFFGSRIIADKTRGRRVSIPGMPLGMYLKRPFGYSGEREEDFPNSGSEKWKGQWSDERMVKVPEERPSQIRGWSWAVRGGGEQMCLAPWKEGRERWERVRKRYWGQV